MLTPAYKLTIGDRIVDTTAEPQASTVVELEVAVDMETPADRLLLVLGQVGGLDPAVDDDFAVELGYAGEDGLTQVLQGTLVAVEPGLVLRRVAGHSPTWLLLHTFVDETYEAMTAGEIVRELAAKAGVTAATVEDGITFPAYVVDGRRSVYAHMRDLARLSGFDLYTTHEGELVFRKFANGNAVHVFDYASHLLALEQARVAPAFARVESWGESPGGSQAEEAWAWLTKNFGSRQGTAGSGTPSYLLEAPALRTAGAAQTAADAAFSRLERRALRGRLQTLGAPQIRLGDAVRLRNVPQEALNGVFQVRAVTHRLRKESGFTTTVDFRTF